MKIIICFLVRSILFVFLTTISLSQNYSLQFDGIDDLVRIPDSDSFLDSINNQITLEAWVYIENWISMYPRFIDRSDDQGSDRFILGTDVGTHSAHININGIELWSLDPIPANTWIHIAGTYDGSELKIYINGELNNSTLQSTTISVTESDLYIGNNETINRQFDGRIDEVRIWNVARSEDLIQDTMYDTLSSDYYSTLDSGLVGYWRFEEFEDLGINSDGTDDLRDHSVLGNHGDSEGNPTLSLASVSFTVMNGWNLISVPLTSLDMAYTTIFPSVIPPIYSYSGGYYQVFTLENGNGYWAKFDGEQDVIIRGTGVSGNETSVNQGWNLIGPFAFNIPVQNITSIPPSIIISPFYGFLSGYNMADTLKPGKGYWVKASDAGIIQIQLNEN